MVCKVWPHFRRVIYICAEALEVPREILLLLLLSFLCLSYLMVANLIRLGIWVRFKISARTYYIVRFLYLCWIAAGHTIYPPTERLFPPTGIEPTPFRNSTLKVAGSQMHVTTPGTSFISIAQVVLESWKSFV